METPTARLKNLTDIKGFELFEDYAVDVDGNVWSYKYNNARKLKPGWAKKKGDYLFVRLTNRRGKKQNFYVHRLVAMAFLPYDDSALRVNHINHDSCDNRLENLEWVTRKKGTIDSPKVKGFTLNDDMKERIKIVHAASHRKGLPVPDSYEFTNNIINQALDDYINRYGLRKVMT